MSVKVSDHCGVQRAVQDSWVGRIYTRLSVPDLDLPQQ